MVNWTFDFPQTLDRTSGFKKFKLPSIVIDKSGVYRITGKIIVAGSGGDGIKSGWYNLRGAPITWTSKFPPHSSTFDFNEEREFIEGVLSPSLFYQSFNLSGSVAGVTAMFTLTLVRPLNVVEEIILPPQQPEPEPIMMTVPETNIVPTEAGLINDQDVNFENSFLVDDFRKSAEIGIIDTEVNGLPPEIDPALQEDKTKTIKDFILPLVTLFFVARGG